MSMLKDLVQNADVLVHNDVTMYSLAAVGIAAFVGIYYLGEYLFSDRDPEVEFTPD